MLLFSSSAPRRTKRSNISPDSDFWYTKLGALFGFGTGTIAADPDSALGIPAVFACVRLLSFTTAQIPLLLYKKLPNDDRERAMDTPLGKLLLYPNRWQYPFQFKTMLMGHLLLRGNCFAQKVRNRRGEIEQLIPLSPTRMTVEQGPRGYKQYILDDDDNSKRRVFSQDDIFHCTGMTNDGLVGYSPITVARRVFEGQLAADEYHANFYENSAQPSGILKMPGALKDEEAVKRLKKSWNDAHAGRRNAHKVAVLENGLEWQQIGLSSKDSDYVNEQRLGIQHVAMIFGVPPHMIQDLSRATFSNIEEQSISFVVYSLMSWLRNFEEALAFSLIPKEQGDQYYIEFLVDGLLRGNSLARQEALAVKRQNGVITGDEWRRLENMNQLPKQEGQAVFINGAMVPVGIALNPPENPKPGDNKEGTPPKLKKDPTLPVPQTKNSLPFIDGFEQGAWSVIRDNLARITRKHEKWGETAAKKPDFDQIRGEYLQNQCEMMRETLLTSIRNYCHVGYFKRFADDKCLSRAAVGAEKSLEAFSAFYVEHALTHSGSRLEDTLRQIIDDIVENEVFE